MNITKEKCFMDKAKRLHRSTFARIRRRARKTAIFTRQTLAFGKLRARRKKVKKIQKK